MSIRKGSILLSAGPGGSGSGGGVSVTNGGVTYTGGVSSIDEMVLSSCHGQNTGRNQIILSPFADDSVSGYDALHVSNGSSQSSYTRTVTNANGGIFLAAGFGNRASGTSALGSETRNVTVTYTVTIDGGTPMVRTFTNLVSGYEQSQLGSGLIYDVTGGELALGGANAGGLSNGATGLDVRYHYGHETQWRYVVMPYKVHLRNELPWISFNNSITVTINRTNGIFGGGTNALSLGWSQILSF